MKKIKIPLIILAFVGIIFIALNPTLDDLKEKLPTSKEFQVFYKEEGCLIYGRSENYIFFSKYEVSNYCYEDNGYIKKDNDNIPIKTVVFYGLLKNFYPDYTLIYKARPFSF